MYYTYRIKVLIIKLGVAKYYFDPLFWPILEHFAIESPFLERHTRDVENHFE